MQVRVKRMHYELQYHPVEDFVYHLCSGLEQGFDTLVSDKSVIIY